MDDANLVVLLISPAVATGVAAILTCVFKDKGWTGFQQAISMFLTSITLSLIIIALFTALNALRLLQ